MMDIKEITFGPETVVSVRHEHLQVGDLPRIIGPNFMELADFLGKSGVEVTGNPYVAYFGMTAEATLDENDMTIEIGFPVKDAVPVSGKFRCAVREAAPAIQVVYKGNYDAGMVAVYQEMVAWINQHGHSFPGVSYEYYLSGPEVPVDEHVTIITMPYGEK